MKKNYILFLFTCLFVFSTNAQTTISHSTDPVTINDGGVACWSSGTGEYRDNSFYRAYNLTTFGITADFNVISVEYGQGAADDGKVIEVAIYTVDTEDLSTATFTLLQSATHTSAAADDLTLITVPIVTTIPAGSIVAVEVFGADSGTNTGETFFPGFNDAGESDDSYIESQGCSITPPATLTGIGFPDNQYVINLVGNESLSVNDYLFSSVSISPNPANDIINIELENSLTVKSTEIFSVLGQKVFSGTTETTIDISELTAGVYMLKVFTDQGEVTKKIIKQ